MRCGKRIQIYPSWRITPTAVRPHCRRPAAATPALSLPKAAVGALAVPPAADRVTASQADPPNPTLSVVPDHNSSPSSVAATDE